MLGAAALTGLAAMRTGAGLVTIGVPQSLNSALQEKISPVIMTLPLPETKEQTLSAAAAGKLRKLLPKFSAIAIGPGLSQNPGTQRFIHAVITHAKQPMVVDADALIQVTRSQSHKVTSKSKKRQRLATSDQRLILTPHVGEMARLTGRSKAWIEAHRREAALKLAADSGTILLLKGHRTVVASPTGKIYINKTGNPGMATAGSGDVLTGMIAALLAQGVPAFDAAKIAAGLHGLAGDLAAKKHGLAGMIATDIIEMISKAIKIETRRN